MDAPARRPDNLGYVGGSNQHSENVAQPLHKVGAELPAVVFFDEAHKTFVLNTANYHPKCVRYCRTIVNRNPAGAERQCNQELTPVVWLLDVSTVSVLRPFKLLPALGDTHDTIGKTISLPRGASDAFLAPWHVERSKIFVRERFAGHSFIDADRICSAIELTWFPVPEDEDYKETDTEAGLLRAADLIGQLADPFYPRKLNALFYEFEEIGCNAQLGYASPADVADQYPRFFWSKVEPFIGEALNYLELTVEGRQWVANLYCNVFEIEHGRRRMGPHNRRA